jgi:hypothetical protein
MEPTFLLHRVLVLEYPLKLNIKILQIYKVYSYCVLEHCSHHINLTAQEAYSCQKFLFVFLFSSTYFIL